MNRFLMKGSGAGSLVASACAVLLTLCGSTEAQQLKIPRIGRLAPSTATADEIVLSSFRQGLRDHGWIEHKNVGFVYRFADGKIDRLAGLAAELVNAKVDVILSGATVGALAAKRATATIPIVIVTTGDPVAAGLVASLARPGGNLTGVTALGQELTGKRLQVLKESRPGISHIAILSNPRNPDSKFSVHEVELAARDLGVKVQVHEASEPAQFSEAFKAMAAYRAAAAMVLTDPVFFTYRKRLVDLAAQHRLPTMYPISEFATVGGLMFYGASFPEMYLRSAAYVDKILKGAKPADLPVQQATKFELVINLKAAKQIGLTIPPNVLARADRVIR